MNRKDFVKMCGLLGISQTLPYTVMSCLKDTTSETRFKGKVVIIGAGAGGLTAGYLLAQQGVDFEILEASNTWGGRMRVHNNFADFPIPLGAEWIETGTDIFKRLVNDASVNPDIKTVEDDPDRKFVNYSWYHFYEEFILPSVAHKVKYNTVVKSINYTSQKILIDAQNTTTTADKVIVSVPLKVLQDGDLEFIPSLPANKLSAISETHIWEGFKAFFEFSNQFYSEEYVFPISPKTDGEKIFYNASLGQNTSKNILGLFVVGTPAIPYQQLSELALKEEVLRELDEIYDNQATPNYLKHISKNWNNEPFIKSGYMTDHADWRAVKTLGEPVANKLHFAGGAYTDGEDWVSVHAAALSAFKAVSEL
jgi:monoamine oxidase